ncbi:hypothetical protein ACFWN1_24420 [Streptomyces sp. NPDC058459]|uniref:hypothetical protein n=1 Tax=Streptomyces sp. NPDC058459 TaxID=3346508 RepID=UPI00365DFA74
MAARWRKHAFAGLDAMASRRRLRSDPLGLRPVLLAEAAGGRRFGELADLLLAGKRAEATAYRREHPSSVSQDDVGPTDS